MTIKSITVSAETIEYGDVTLWLDDENNLNYRRGYRFLDANGQEVSFENYGVAFAPPVLMGKMAWVDVPENIRVALSEIDAYTKAEIDQREGIE